MVQMFVISWKKIYQNDELFLLGFEKVLKIQAGIIRAKDEHFKLCKEKNIARKSCPSPPNVNVKHVEDILHLFPKNVDNLSIPQTFAAKGLALCRLLGLILLHP